jgi:hypothetical protein
MCRQEHQSDPASDCAGAKSEHCTAGMNAQVYSDRARSTGCRAGGRSKAITPPFRSITGRPILTFELCSAPRESEAGGDPREEFLEKKRQPARIRGKFEPRVRAATSPRLFSVKVPATDSRHFRCGARGARWPYARTHPWRRTMDPRRMG